MSRTRRAIAVPEAYKPPKNAVPPKALPLSVDPNADFELAVSRLKELANNENPQVAVKAASDLSKLMRPHVKIAPEPEKTTTMGSEDFIKTTVWLAVHEIESGTLSRETVADLLAPLLRLLEKR